MQPPITTSLDAIKVRSAPPKEPDRESKGEEKQYGDAALTANLTAHVYSVHKSHTAYLQKEHRRLQKENKSLQDRLDNITPKHAALHQASQTNSRMDVLSLIFAGVGAGAVGIAPYFFLNYTQILVGGGTVSLVIGYVMLGYVKLLCWPKSPEKWHLDR